MLDLDGWIPDWLRDILDARDESAVCEPDACEDCGQDCQLAGLRVNGDALDLGKCEPAPLRLSAGQGRSI